jgi:hypothetical protein
MAGKNLGQRYLRGYSRSRKQGKTKQKLKFQEAPRKIQSAEIFSGDGLPRKLPERKHYQSTQSPVCPAPLSDKPTG